MSKRMSVRWLSLLMAIFMCFGLLQPATVFAAEAAQETEAVESTETAQVTEPAETVAIVEAEVVAEVTAADASDDAGVADYQSFLSNLKVLENYADAYAASSGKDATELVINFIRTGVDRYNDGNWKTLAGEEITGFTTYVEEQDAANVTTAMLLRNIMIDDFTLPNGNQVDFGHMFGTLNIAYVAATATADLGGWAGDICDLMIYSKNYGNVPAGTVDEMAAYIRANCFGVDADDAFGMDDFYGDMDAYYLNNQVKAGNKLSAVMEAYFTASLSDSDRGAYFLNNRFSGLQTQEDVRAAVYNAYASNVGLQVLEADRGLSDDADLRSACCYAFADYLFEQAGNRLEGGSGEEGGDTGDEEEDDVVMDNEYYSVFSSTSSILAPGIEQTIKYAMTADNKQIVYYVATVDVTREDVTIMANYRDNDPSKGWGMQRVADQAAALMAKHTDPADTENYIENFNAIVATNADGYNMSTGEPGGLLVMEGVEWHGVDGDGFFAILKDGTAMIGTKADYATYKDQIQEAVGGFGAVLIKDGEVAINKSSAYYTTRASRTAIGITAEGKVVMMVLDGRQEPFSAGGSMEEIAQIMLDAGCVEAINLDGGGSTTYLSKSEGSDSLQLVNRPSDGYARSVATSLVAVSTAKSSKEFDHANITSEYDYLTMGTQLQMSATGVSNTGNAAPIPEDAVWAVSDETVGSITEDGVFTAAATGEVDVQLVLNGKVLSSKTLYVVLPDEIVFEKSSMNVVCGVPTELPVIVRYEGNEVAFNEYDVILFPEHEESGTCEGLYFTANEDCEIRVETMYVLLLLPESELYTSMKVTLYKSDEAVFDFDTASHGDRQFAWNRDVSNSTTIDETVYYITDVNEAMDITYVFALDMESIEIPAQLSELTYMLPGADTGATAWDFLLQLAERVSVLTEVRIVAQFDPDLDVDISELTVANEYFYQKSATLDENNTLTLICGWYDQTAAIDPATANPICILSGIKATPKNDSWDADNQVSIINSGEVSYKIYLRASSLYSFAQSAANQQKFGLYPYSSEEVLYNGGPEQGAYFGSTYATFTDSFALDKSNRQGWYQIGDYHYYFVDNEALTGIHYLPSREDASVKLFYEFEEDGVLNGTVTGLVEQEDGLYYAVQGEMLTGWRAMYDAQGNAVDYFFDRTTGKAVDGIQTIDGYTYTFTDHILTRGDLVTDSTGTRYRWAGAWVHGKWFEVDGNTYHTAKYSTYVTTGYAHIVGQDLEYGWHLFDENGVFQKDYTGKYYIGEDIYLLENGVLNPEPGLVLLDDGYYYYFCSTGKAVKNCTYWPSKTNGLLPYGPYQFDAEGRMINPPTSDPEEPEVEVKNGVVEENGNLYYYVNGALQYAAGLVQLEDGSYIYVRSNGQLSVGSYWITNTNGLLDQGLYNFGEDGKLVIDTEEPDQGETEPPVTEPDQGETEEPEMPAKNGVVSENGGLYYYVDGKLAYCAGLVQLADSSYIYVRSDGQLATGTYWVTNTNGLMNQGMHTFGADGIMLDPPASGDSDQPVKNGVVELNGVLYYYVNDAIAYCAGVVQLADGSYIYVRSNGQLAVGTYWVTNTNGLMVQGMHQFDEDGIMLDPPTTEVPEEPEVLDGIVDVNGTLYYYKDGTIAYAAGLNKLVDEDGAEFYIYVRSNGQLATGIYWPTNHNDLLPYKGYDFGENGRLYL